jgi:acetaldehyde dehydrogenase (acetylating)
MPKLRVGILGSGNIGTDLLYKVGRSYYLECAAFIGRNLESKTMLLAKELGVTVSDKSINYIIDNTSKFDLIFDCTSAEDHIKHAPILKSLGIQVIDMTPAKVGTLCIPALNLAKGVAADNVNMVTCGGQASVPIAACINRTHPDVRYIEVVSSIASNSAGMATRQNLDEYIHTTERALLEFTGALTTKAILILNPASPEVNMQTTIFAKVANPSIIALKAEIEKTLEVITAYVPGYQLLVGPIFENGRIVVTVKVEGMGDYLPKYAGNLDIINCAAIAVAEQKAIRKDTCL